MGVQSAPSARSFSKSTKARAAGGNLGVGFHGPPNGLLQALSSAGLPPGPAPGTPPGGGCRRVSGVCAGRALACCQRPRGRAHRPAASGGGRRLRDARLAGPGDRLRRRAPFRRRGQAGPRCLPGPRAGPSGRPPAGWERWAAATCEPGLLEGDGLPGLAPVLRKAASFCDRRLAVLPGPGAFACPNGSLGGKSANALWKSRQPGSPGFSLLALASKQRALAD